MTTAQSLNSEFVTPMNAGGRTHRTTLGLLLWLFGFTGAHRFYYGRSTSGTVQFALFAVVGAISLAFGPFAPLVWLTIGLPLLAWWIVDLFLLGSMQSQATRSYVAGPYSYSVSWLLQTFLGYAGIHRLYLGKWVSGGLMLVMALAVPGSMFLLWPLALVCGAIYLYDFWTLNELVSGANTRRLS